MFSESILKEMEDFIRWRHRTRRDRDIIDCHCKLDKFLGKLSNHTQFEQRTILNYLRFVHQIHYDCSEHYWRRMRLIWINDVLEVAYFVNITNVIHYFGIERNQNHVYFATNFNYGRKSPHVALDLGHDCWIAGFTSRDDALMWRLAY